MSTHGVAIAAVMAAALVALLPVVDNGFVNWDDPFTLVNNGALAAPGVIAWAFTTTHMGHYQPLSWLVWSEVTALAGPEASAFHALSLFGHVLNAALVYIVSFRLSLIANLEVRPGRVAAVVAALAFAVHPMRVEVVAWASAFPYVLSLGLLLLSLLAYLAACREDITRRTRNKRLMLSIAIYAVSELTRATAIAFPFVLLALDVYPLRRTQSLRRRTARHQWSRLVVEKLPFFAVALAMTVAESRARELATLQEVTPGARLTMAATSPFVYLGRTLLPIHLRPIDPLPIESGFDATLLMLGAATLAAVTVATWKARLRWPLLIVGWIAYLLLLAPVAGLTPTGQQATADRYMYLPGVVVAVVIGSAVAYLPRTGPRRRAWLPLLLGILIASAAATWRQTMWWHDAVTLWSRAVDLDARNDIATYNLALALADEGREDEAIVRYEQTLQLVPDHTHARHNLNLLLAGKAEREGNRLVEAGRLDEAVDRYSEALRLDPLRRHARTARGLTELRRGRFAAAAVDLGRAVEGSTHDPDIDVVNGLAFALVQIGELSEAIAVLKQAQARHPDDVELSHNLARLLATAPDPALREGATALRLALEVRRRTGGADPRVLDTLAAAYAETGQFDLARETADQAVVLARQRGDVAMAREIEAHARRYQRSSVR